MARIEDFINRRIQGPPKEEIGIGGFTAVVRVSERYNLTAEAPATAVEDGSFVNDHIILKPLTLSISGDVSNVHLRASPLVAGLQRLGAVIGDISAQYLPGNTQAQASRVTALANDAVDRARQIDSAIDRGQKVLDFFQGNMDEESAPLQKRFVDAMEALHFGKVTFPIDMPHRRHENMVITSLSIAYDNQANSTTFSLDAQQIQYAELVFSENGTPNPAEGVNGQTDKAVSNGAQEGEAATDDQESSIFYDLIGG